MKVLLLNRSYYPNVGGIENSLHFLSQQLQQQGHEVMILTQEPNGSFKPRDEYASIVRYPRYKYNKLLLPVAPFVEERKIAKWIVAHKTELAADAVICRDPMLGLAYSRVFKDAKIAYIPAVIIKYYNKGIRKADSIVGFVKEVLRFLQLKIEQRQQKQIMAFSKRVVVFSENVKSQIASGKICNLDKVSVCYPGVSKKISNEQEKGADKNLPTFLFVGRLVAEKNLEMLIKAFRNLPCDNKKMIVVGDGQQRSSLETLVNGYHLEQSVLFTGETKEPELYYRQADFFVLPSKYESFGQVIVEALTAGLPVIGFKTIPGKTLTAVSELIETGKNGFVCDAFSEDALCEAMHKAITVFEEKTQYQAMRENCIAFAEENFSWKKLADACIL